MNEEVLQAKLDSFLNLSKEEKHKIDNDERYDELFSILDEMEEVVNEGNTDG